MTIVARRPRVRWWRGGGSPPGANLPGGFVPGADRHTLEAAATWSRRLALAAAASWLPVDTAPLVLGIAAVGFAAGIPHGAIDHLTATRLTGRTSVATAAVVYAALAVTAWALMTWLGTAGLLVAVALSALHFGLGELEVSRQLTGWRPNLPVAVAITVAGCGALILPLARAGDQLTGVAAAVSPGIDVWLGSAWLPTALVVSWLAAAAVAVTGAFRAGRPLVAVDIVLIGLLGALAPPLLAFAVWFGGWHALRHCARMLTVEPGCAQLVAVGLRRAAVARFARLAAWPSVAAFSAVAILGWFTLMAHDPAGLVAEVLRVLLALTAPHMAVVAWLDRMTGR